MVGADVVTVGTIIGALIGTVTFLLRVLIQAKTAHIETLQEHNREVTEERNLFRDLVLTSRGRKEDA
jgi:hypothetical protein